MLAGESSPPPASIRSSPSKSLRRLAAEGLATAVALTHFLNSLLYGVEAQDPGMLLALMLALGLVALLLLICPQGCDCVVGGVGGLGRSLIKDTYSNRTTTPEMLAKSSVILITASPPRPMA